jgi:3D (Asp-Asp-Asp) domain-containing protein
MTNIGLLLLCLYLNGAQKHPPKYLGEFKVTHYDRHYKWGNVTKLGLKPCSSIVAVDPKVIPLGSLIFAESYGFLFAGDTGTKIRGRHLDVWKMRDSNNVRVWLLTKS